jgi:N-acetylglutamate synthase
VAISIDDLEHAAAPGWRAREEARLGDWLLRAADGFTGRANSALATGDPGLPLTVAIEKVRSWYAERSLPAMIAVPYPMAGPGDSELDQLLARLGWTIRADGATVMTASAADVAASADAAATDTVAGGGHGFTTTFAAEPDAAWLARYHYRGQDLPPVAREVLTSAPWQAFGSVRADGETVAIGRAAGAGDWAGLTAIEVDQARRRQGLGAAITVALTAHAADHGFANIYLQVTDENAGARALYRKLAFTDHHGYHYRVAPACQDQIGTRHVNELAEGALPDLADPEIMATAWRTPGFPQTRMSGHDQDVPRTEG